ncbi:MAG: hypothetical protein CHACPFDD_00979 [Phycisphaerae bacterium]|nr:hypothetical protein [Phycisphaerae bacterium]
MDVNPPNDAERLLALLSEQRDRYLTLRELSRRQRTLITDDRPDLLLTILTERQGLVSALARLNDELAPFRRDWNQTYGTLSEVARQAVSKLVTEINELLSEIMKTDREDGKLLSIRKQMIEDETSGLSGGRLANASYARAARPDGGSSADITG